MGNLVKSLVAMLLTAIFIVIPTLLALSLILNWNMQFVYVMIFLSVLEVGVFTIGLATTILSDYIEGEQDE